MTDNGTHRTSPTPKGLLRAAIAIAITATTTTARPETAQAYPYPEREAYTLSEAGWDAYQQLEEGFTRIANGETTSAEIAVDIPRMLGQEEWSVDDFGIEPVSVVGAVNDEEGTPLIHTRFKDRATEEAKAQLERALTVLKWERPDIADWYWLNGGASLETTWRAENKNGKWFVAIASSTICCSVMPSYRNNDRFEVRPDAIAQMRQSVAVAQVIASKHAGETPRQRLSAYCDEIDALSNYDHGASDDSFETDSRPWHVTSVFDGDPSTGSVCQAYSEALKLLVNLSGRDDVLCHTMTGRYKSVLFDGAHMWCTVVMPDGKNYIVDVTNNSKNAAMEGKLFLAPLGGSPEEGFGCDVVHFTYSDTAKQVYQPWALTISDTPYAGDIIPQEEPSPEPTDEMPLVVFPTSPTAEDVPTETTEAEEPQPAPEKMAWTLDTTDNAQTITVVVPKQSSAERDAARIGTERTVRWMKAISAAFLAGTISSALLVAFHIVRRK